MNKVTGISCTKYIFSQEEKEKLLDVLWNIIHTTYDINDDGEVTNLKLSNSWDDLEDSDAVIEHKEILKDFLTTSRCNHNRL